MKIFISFKFNTDKHYRFLLSAWNNNPNNSIEFDDGTPSEINSWDFGRIKAVLTTKIKQSDAVLVIVGADSASLDPDFSKIGYDNWQSFEIAKAKDLGKPLIAVKIHNIYPYPDELRNSNAILVHSFNQQSIFDAINQVRFSWRW